MEFRNEKLSVIFGILGNIISFLVFLAPVPTFYKIVKKKSSAGYPSLPYIIALFSASLLLYYGILKRGAYLLIVINVYGGVIELIYLSIYISYAPKRIKIFTAGVLLLVNIGFFGAIFLFSWFFPKNLELRITVIGWICATVNVVVFASPLSNLVTVIKTKNVEFMPIALSFFLALNATMWFFYGFFLGDLFIAVPNVLGVLFGILQMIMYCIYKKANPVGMNDPTATSDGKVHPENDV